MSGFFWATVCLFALVPLAALGARGPRAARVLWLGVGTAGAAQALLGALQLTFGGTVPLGRLPGMPPYGPWDFTLGNLGGWFFVLLGVTGAAASAYAAGHARHRPGAGRVAASVAASQYVFTSFLLTADNALPMLIAWEGMSLCAYVYILTDHGARRSRHAAYQTLAVSEAGFLMLVVAVAAAASVGSGDLGFSPLSAGLARSPEWLRVTVFFLGFFGFGVKSGVFPLQLWMPRAYDAVPPHLAAILAGGLLNLGLFGMLRVYGWVGPLPSTAGLAVVGLGAAAVFLGALYALIESRLKMILAFSSMESVGLILIGFGLGISFSGAGIPRFAAVALTAMAIQATSHAFAKALAFLSVGEVSLRTGRAEIDSLGGLFSSMPAAGIGLLVASLTLSAVAPFSGFVSEWLTLQSMLQAYRGLTPPEQVVVVSCGLAAAMGAAMALTAFLRLFSFVFTGRSRTGRPARPDQGGTRARAAGILGLAGVSALFGVFPTFALAGLDKVVAGLPPGVNPIADVAPAVFRDPSANALLTSLGGGLFSFLPLRGAVIQPAPGVSSISPTYVLGWFLVIAVVLYGSIRFFRRSPYGSRGVSAWAGGATVLAPENQYTASAFANPHRMLFASLLRYELSRSVLRGRLDAPRRLSVRARVAPWLQGAPYRPVLRAFRRFAGGVVRVQHGYLWGYVYAMVAAVLALLFIAAYAR